MMGTGGQRTYQSDANRYPDFGFAPADPLFAALLIIAHMAYQKNWPTLLAYVAAVVVFLVAAAYAVVYATGYRLDLKTWTLKETGVLAITTKPSGATVVLNDIPQARKTPFTLRNALPGAYHIKLTLDGYLPYEKDLEVRSNQATEEHNVDLVLSDRQPMSVAENVNAILHVGDELWAWTGDKQFVKVGNPNTPLELDKLPTNVATILTQATGLYLAKKHDNGNHIALGVMVGSKRWLVVMEPGGYRGQSFGAPLNQVTTENLFWIDADRLMAFIGGSLYAIDMNLNQTRLYTRSITGVTYANGKVYYIARDKQSQLTLYRDNNLFDDRPAEAIFSNVPVASHHEIMLTPDEAIMLLADNRSTKGLWLAEPDPTDRSLPHHLTKLASSVHGTLYDYLNEQLLFVQNRTVSAYDVVLKTTRELRRFTDTPQLIGKRNESVFLATAGKFWTADPDLSNLYELASSARSTLLLGPDSRRVWLFANGTLNELTLRVANQGVFGVLPDWLGRING